MGGFVLHPAAFRDINEIWEFIAADNLDAADRILDELRESLEKLVDFSEMGFRRAELTPKPLRFFPVRDFLIAYAPEEKPLLVWCPENSFAKLASLSFATSIQSPLLPLSVIYGTAH